MWFILDPVRRTSLKKRMARRFQLLSIASFYELMSNVEKSDVGNRNFECQHCGALKFANETSIMCCMNGKINVPDLPPLPSFYRELWYGTCGRSQVFRKYARQLNNALSMSSIKVSNGEPDSGYRPTVIVQVCPQKENDFPAVRY